MSRDKTKEAYYCHSEAKGDGLFAVFSSRSQTKLVLAGVGTFLIAGYFYIVMANVLLYETIRHGVEKMPPLVDLLDATLLASFTDRPKFWTGIIDGASVLLPISAAGYLVMMGKTKRFVLFMATLALVYFFKSTFQCLTILPAAHPGCFHKRLTGGEQLAMNGFAHDDVTEADEYKVPEGWAWVFYSANGLPGCNDMIFSGHTSAILVSVMSLRTTLLQHGTSGVVVFMMGAIGMCVYIYFVLAMKMHYAVDIAVALLVGLLMFTHAPMRFWIWCTMNKLVGNSLTEDGESEPLMKKDEKKDEEGYSV